MAVSKLVQRHFSKWLEKTTCKRHKLTIYWDNGRFAIFKHHGHSEYVGAGNADRCATYYALYDCTETSDRIGYGDGAIWKAQGRWKNKYCDVVKQVITKHREKQTPHELAVDNIKYLQNSVVDIQQDLERMLSVLSSDERFMTGNEMSDMNKQLAASFSVVAALSESLPTVS